MRCSVSITPFSADASMGIMAQDHRPGEVRMYAPMMYRKARGGDLGNILVRGRNYMRGHVRDRKQIAASVAASVGLGPMQALVR